MFFFMIMMNVMINVIMMNVCHCGCDDLKPVAFLCPSINAWLPITKCTKMWRFMYTGIVLPVAQSDIFRAASATCPDGALPLGIACEPWHLRQGKGSIIGKLAVKMSTGRWRWI